MKLNREKEHILSLSYGKDSLACLAAIEKLKWPLDRVIHAEIWATDEVKADLPPMVEFKEKADEIIKKRWGITVEHIKSNMTFEEGFYRQRQKGKKQGKICGWPRILGAWCNSVLKVTTLKKAQSLNTIEYVGIAADERKRLGRLSETKKSPLAEAGWAESFCFDWCKKNNLLSPIYTTTNRGGCWFCHNQPIDQLRLLRKNYPDLWELMLKWDNDSPYSFHADGKTVHDFEKRFEAEDCNLIFAYDKNFRWNSLEQQLNYRWF